MSASHLLPVVIASIILFLILVPCIAVLIVHKRYRRVAKSLPHPKTVERAHPEKLEERRNALASDLVGDWIAVPDQEKAATRAALWTAMLLEAASDGSLDHRELHFVADLVGQMGGDDPAQDGDGADETIVEAAGRVHDDRKAALAEISKARGVSKASKEHILAGAFLVSVSDHALAESETDCLGDIADALAINQRDRKIIFKRLADRFGI